MKSNSQRKAAESSPAPPSSSMDASSRFSLVELRKIHEQLVENKHVDESSKDLVVEILRVIAEMVVYGDNKSEMLFDFFCEKNMLQLFLEIMWTEKGCPAPVHIQILQTLSILISCVKNDTSLYYLLSNNYINEMINFPHDFADESLVAQFASFMKSLSLRLNVQTVQFFFIEETGAFPLLSKAVELLSNADPMIRISAQTTILNVYQVDEPRSRAYALQDEVMAILFEGIVKIMKDQLAAVQKHAVDFVRGSAQREMDLTKVKQNCEDTGIAIEDWLYYLQDLFDLKIEVLQRALSSHLLNHFVAPLILQAVVTAHKSLQPDFLPLTRMSSLEIESADKNDSKRSRVSVSLNEEEEQELITLGLASSSLYYLLNMVKILSSPILRHTIATAMCHPLSQEARIAVLLQIMEQRSSFDLSAVDTLLNPFKEALQFFLSADHPLIVLLVVYIYYYLTLGCCEGDWSPDLDNLRGKAHFLESLCFLPALGVSIPAENIDWNILKQAMENEEDSSKEAQPQDADPEETWKKRRRGLHVKKSIAACPFGPDYLSATMLAEVNRAASASVPEPSLDVDLLCRVLATPSNFSLTAVQVSVHSIVSVTKLLFCFAKSLHASDPAAETFDGLGTLALQHIVKQVRTASRNAATALLARLDSHFSEMLLILINEEIKRFQGRKWKAIFPRMSTEKLLMVPETPHSKLRLGMDFALPISQVESARREVQHFLLMRALQKHLLLFNLFKSKDAESAIFDLSSVINDRDFLCVDETNLVPEQLVTGNAFDMKGKKFLDTKIFSDEEERASAADAHNAQHSSSWSASLLGFMGTSRKPSSSTSSPASGVGSKGGAHEKNTHKDKHLFVQDPNLLLVILQKRVDGKSTFRVHVVASLIYTDAKLDLSNKKKLVIMVRSWKGVENMHKIEMDEDGGAEDSPRHSSKGAACYLNNPQRSSIYQITLTMDTEQGAALAAQHIESRRKALTAIKMEKFKNMLNKWASANSDVFENE